MQNTVTINETLLADIDKCVLDERRIQWKAAVRESGCKLYVDRDKYAADSWKETAGEDIQIRRAKLFKNVADHVAINILPYDFVVGRIGPELVGNYTSIDICGDYIDGLWDDSGELQITLHDKITESPEEIEVLRESVRTFANQNPVDGVNKAWKEIFGNWPRDALEAHIKDPDLTSGNFGNSSNTLDFKKILNKGFRYYIKEAQGHIDDFMSHFGQNADQIFFWKSAIIVCEAIINHAHRYAALAQTMAETEPDASRKAELLDIAGVCMRVPEYPARNFREALQSMVLAGLGKALEHPMFNQPHWGRGDQYLYPFFINDINSGTLTAQDSLSMLAEVVGRWGTQHMIAGSLHKKTHQITYGINSMNLGGTRPDGTEGANELSYLFLHTVGMLQQSSPTVLINWNRNTPRWLMMKAIKTNKLTGGGIPLFENDDLMVEHYVKDGVPIEEARTWFGRGCVWPALPQRSEYKGGAAAFNSAAALHMALHNGVAVTGMQLGPQTGDPRNFRDFNELYDAYVAQHRYGMNRTLWLADIAREVQYKYIRLPYLSVSSIRDCMDKGRDTMMPTPFCEYGITDRAVIDVADSMIAVKKLVFDEKKLTMDELLDALDSDFAGKRGEEIRTMCLNAPKFGNDIDEVDKLASKIGEMSAKSVTEWKHSPYPAFKSLREGLSWHYAAGLGVGALPNGRHANEPLDDASASPMRGMDKSGPTAVLRSVLKANFGKDSYVVALNQKLGKNLLNSDDNVAKLVDYTIAFLAAGGTHIQYNIVDNAELREAKLKPEQHEDLIVRVGGFSAYFVQLSPQIQDDIIGRSEHCL